MSDLLTDSENVATGSSEPRVREVRRRNASPSQPRKKRNWAKDVAQIEGRIGYAVLTLKTVQLKPEDPNAKLVELALRVLTGEE